MAVSDLTNTTWLINSVTCTAGYGIFNINYTCTHEGEDYECDTIWIGYRATGEGAVASANQAVVDELAGENLWAGDTITITVGTDATNASLISWLEANATQQGGGTSGKTQLGTRPITKKMFGTREITKEVVNGVVVYEKQASSFNVDITLNNTGDLTWGNVYIYDGQDSTGTLLYSLEKNIPATISTSVQCSTGYLCIRGTASGDPQDSIALNTSLSNNVAVIYEAEGSTFDGKYQITGNATLVANCHYAY